MGINHCKIFIMTGIIRPVQQAVVVKGGVDGTAGFGKNTLLIALHNHSDDLRVTILGIVDKAAARFISITSLTALCLGVVVRIISSSLLDEMCIRDRGDTLGCSLTITPSTRPITAAMAMAVPEIRRC